MWTAEQAARVAGCVALAPVVVVTVLWACSRLFGFAEIDPASATDVPLAVLTVFAVSVVIYFPLAGLALGAWGPWQAT